MSKELEIYQFARELSGAVEDLTDEVQAQNSESSFCCISIKRRPSSTVSDQVTELIISRSISGDDSDRDTVRVTMDKDNNVTIEPAVFEPYHMINTTFTKTIKDNIAKILVFILENNWISVRVKFGFDFLDVNCFNSSDTEYNVYYDKDPDSNNILASVEEIYTKKLPLINEVKTDRFLF